MVGRHRPRGRQGFAVGWHHRKVYRMQLRDPHLCVRVAGQRALRTPLNFARHGSVMRCRSWIYQQFTSQRILADVPARFHQSGGRKGLNDRCNYP
jgi:hypothetical protein